MAYDYHTLSPGDFERFCTDLLGAEMGQRFEQFAEGPDDGIDMRCRVEGGLIIGQAKRYQRFADLRQAVESERAKVAKLKPQRYVLMTSCSLTPANKTQLVEALAPFCRESGDIWGRDELGAALARQPQVLRRHVGLWLQDEAQLQLVLHNGAQQLSAATRDMLESRLRYFVVYAEMHYWLAQLQKQHLLIVTGDAGVGKSTLCGYLALQLAAQDDYELQFFHDTAGLRDSWQLLQPARKQCFVLDDFLGATFLDDKAALAVERALIQLMERATNRQGRFKLLIASRGYVVQQAAERLPKLQAWLAANQSTHLVTIAYDKLSDRAKADILYNLVYFSPLGAEQQSQLVGQRLYWRIIQHRHFNPRLIGNILATAPEYTQQTSLDWLLTQLDDPMQYWEKTFERLSPEARCFLYRLALCRGEVGDAEFSRAYAALYRAMYNCLPPPNGLQAALGELEPDLVVSFEDKQIVWLAFATPSVADMTHRMMQQHAGLLDAVMQALTYYEQARHLLRLHQAEGNPIQLCDDQHAMLLRQMASLIDHTQQQRVNGLGRTWLRRTRQGEQVSDCWAQIRRADETVRQHPDAMAATELLTARVREADWTQWLPQGNYNPLLHLAFDLLPQSGWLQVIEAAVNQLRNTEDATALASWYRRTESVAEYLDTELELLQDNVADACIAEIEAAEAEEHLEQIISDIQTLETDLSLDLDGEKYQAWEMLESLQFGEEEPDEDEPPMPADAREDIDVERRYVDALFGGATFSTRVAK